MTFWKFKDKKFNCRVGCLTILIQIIAASNTVLVNLKSELKDELFKKYNPSNRPVEMENSTLNVYMDITIKKLLNLDERTEKIVLQTWIKFEWKDPFLVWENNSKYNEIKHIRVESHKVFIPDIMLFNGVTEKEISSAKSSSVAQLPVKIYSNGHIERSYPQILSASCSLKMDDFPMDEQICPLQFASWSYSEQEMQLFNHADAKEGIERTDSHGEWEFVDFLVKRISMSHEHESPNVSHTNFYLILRRKPLIYLSTIVFPTLIIVLMSLFTCMFLPAISGEKMGLHITSLLSLSVLLQIVSNMIPPQSTSFPRINIFFSGSLIALAFIYFTEIWIIYMTMKGNLNLQMNKSLRHLCFVYLAPIVCLKGTVKQIFQQKTDPNCNGFKLSNKKKSFAVNKGADTNSCNDMQLGKLNKTKDSTRMWSIETIDAEHQLQLETIVDKLRTIELKFEEMEKSDRRSKEWQVCAMIIGRAAGIIYLICVLLMFVIIFNVPTKTRTIDK